MQPALYILEIQTTLARTKSLPCAVLQTLAISSQKVLASLVALIPNSSSAAPTSINLPALIGLVQAVGGLFVQLGAFSAAQSG